MIIGLKSLTKSQRATVAEIIATVAESFRDPVRLAHHVILALHMVLVVLGGAAPGDHRPVYNTDQGEERLSVELVLVR